MIEIEKKYRITAEQRAMVEQALAESGCKLKAEEFEENIIYGGALLAEGGVVRVRTTERRTLLTFKKRIESASDIKHQIEHETEVSDPEQLKKILENLGLAPRLVYEKRRRTWDFRNVEVMLDELPFGSFMEIEGSLLSIREAEMMLGLEEFHAEVLTYPRLTAKHGIQRGSVIEARFENNG